MWKRKKTHDMKNMKTNTHKMNKNENTEKS